MRKYSFIVIIFLLIIFTTSCATNNKNVNSEQLTEDSISNDSYSEESSIPDYMPTMEYNNSIFTEEMQNSLTEIDFWYADEKIAITKQEDISVIFREFASLKLTLENNEEVREGHFLIAFVTPSNTLKCGLLAGELVINTDTERYSLDKDIVQTVEDIALKNKSSK